MFERYNLDAQKVITLAESLAFSYSHQEILPIHIMVAFLKSHETELALIAEKSDIDPYQVESFYLKTDLDESKGHSMYMEYSSQLKNLLDDALKLATKQGDKHVTSLTLALATINLLDEETIIEMGFISKAQLTKELKKSYKRSTELDKITDLHRLGEKDLDPLIGREDILKQLELVLKRRNKPNPILVGEPGVGKSFIVEHLAKMIKDEKIEDFKNKTIFELDLSSSVSGTKYRGEFEEKIKKVINKVIEDGHTILFIDEIHNIVKAGGAEGAIDCSNILKPYLSRGDLQIIGATTYDEYERIFSMDKALKRRFQLIKVNPNTKAETLEILSRLAPIYGEHYRKEVPQNLLQYIVDYADRYLPNFAFPDKAIDILDNSLAGSNKKILDIMDIKTTLSNFFHVEVDREFEPETVINKIKEEVKGQDTALEALKKNLRVLKLKTEKINTKPLGVYLFIGPSGVGKGLTAKMLSDAYFGQEEAYLKIDLTNYKDPGSITRLLGAAPGYVGYKDESTFLKQLKQNPRSLILLDEIEKAHPSVLDIFINGFEDGYFQDASGSKVDCTNAIFILTSNASYSSSGLFLSRLSQNQIDIKKIEKDLAERFRFEFLARLDDIIIFKDLSVETIISIENNYLKQYGTTFEMSEDMIDDDYKNDIKKYGARAALRHAKNRFAEMQKN